MSSAVLAIETSTPLGSVAVMRDGKICFEKTFSSERSHNSQLFAPLREALAACDGPLHAIVVGTGPASYTGVRIGIAAAQGVALSRNGPVVGLPSVLAVEGDYASYHLCGDARRGSFFIANVSGGVLIDDIITCDQETLRRRHSDSSDRVPWLTFDPKPPLHLDHVRCVHPSAAKLAVCAAKLSDDALTSLAQRPLEPCYLSAPFITMPK